MSFGKLIFSLNGLVLMTSVSYNKWRTTVHLGKFDILLLATVVWETYTIHKVLICIIVRIENCHFLFLWQFEGQHFKKLGTFRTSITNHFATMPHFTRKANSHNWQISPNIFQAIRYVEMSNTGLWL